MSFLENTNSLFESYIRKVLKDNLQESIIKWDQPRKFIEMRNSNKKGQKSYSPDILVNYSDLTESALAVIDVKNKSFEPNSMKSLDLLCSTNDLYQIIFYCNQLKSKVGALIYPSSSTNEPVELMMDLNSGLKIFLFSVNMNRSFSSRSRKLINEIRKYMFSEC
jgi:5-methylcytosine-specific restriction endonuclease McrBC regulatory subunit McrC